MSLVASFGGGALIAALGWLTLASTFSSPLFARRNHRGDLVPVSAGIIVVLAVMAVTAAASLLRAASVDVGGADRLPILAAVAGFGLLGLFDDLAGAGDDRGFAGHLRALSRGRLTTGGLKLLGGAVLAVAVVAGTGVGSHLDRRLLHLLADAALVALAANLANLFDRAPGRTTKVALGAFAALVAVTGADPELAGPAAAAGASAALLWPDLRERLMLGDAGANPLGAALGLGVVLTCGPGIRLVVLAVVLALNLVSELASYSRVIDAVPPLRALDRLGRRG